MKSIGICLGASNIKFAILEKSGTEIRVTQSKTIHHECNPKKSFSTLIKEVNINSMNFGILTGRKFRDVVNHSSITEPEAIEYGLSFLRYLHHDYNQPFGAIISLGAENFILYILNEDGTIRSVETGNKCASGTGEFFLQQIRRMNIELQEAIHLASESDMYKVSGRCSVFCKSDCTHALNKGVPIGRVSAGLCSMMADKVMELLEKTNNQKVLAVGGVTQNTAVMKYLKEHIKTIIIPEFASTFEAVGAAFYALQKQCTLYFDKNKLFNDAKSSFETLPALKDSASMVLFKKDENKTAVEGDECIVGLDVGSTTTKAVLLRLKDDAILESVYLRTNGNPVKASQNCYQALIDQMRVNCRIVGIGTTGSGRQIAGLHAQTSGIINEIIAHATAAAFYDKDVDTIFEIGGQDAKFTHLINGVPADYAMNEACSAGTGSFLEEAAQESLGVNYLEIQNMAFNADSPPNFNDQCAAFINSDIKTATQEGIQKENILAGLVYSVCMNYVNRVKGQRSIGSKIFMQGGVCYNKAVPLAMAALIGKKIIVPPEPGLMGAFGVALEIKNRIASGRMKKTTFDLATLVSRNISITDSFICHGGKEKCDRGCEISVLSIGSNKFPFGGACNKYYNMIQKMKHDQQIFDYVKLRNDLLYKYFSSFTSSNATVTVGVSRSFLTNLLLPLYSTFFTSLNCNVLLSDVNPDGMKYKRTAYCYPGEIAHGAYFDLIRKKPEYIFMPIVTELFVENAKCRKPEHQSTCLLLQCEPYFIKSAFKSIPDQPSVISPLLNFSQGYDSQPDKFIEIGKILNKTEEETLHAYRNGFSRQKAFSKKLKEYGNQLLSILHNKPDQIAIVLFGRPYNAFSPEGNLNIPAKFASRGVYIIPWDFLPIDDEPLTMDMCWALGQQIMKASSFVAKDPQLFATFITNFSCGPDSFLLSYFRDIMGSKPSLTLELDSHTADAGVNTRIEAFLDIITRYRCLSIKKAKENSFIPATVTVRKGVMFFNSSQGDILPLNHPDVHLLLPSMGELCSEALAAVFQNSGIQASCLPMYTNETLKLGRSVATCKECLPLLLTTGGLLEYLQNHTSQNEKLVYFMPTSPGNCRFTQYSVFLKRLIEQRKIKNVALLSLTNENSYTGFNSSSLLNAMRSIIISDVMEDIRNAIFVLAKDRQNAMKLFSKQWNEIITALKNKNTGYLYKVLQKTSQLLSEIELKYPLKHAKKVELLGEIFVRRDQFSCQDLIKRLSRRDIVVKRASVLEWLKYCDWNVEQGIYKADFPIAEWVKFNLKCLLSRHYEIKIKKIMAQSGLYEFELVNIDKIIQYGKQFFDVHLTGEAILVVGDFFKDILHSAHGVISIGPFACMPTRIIESVLSAEANMQTKKELDNFVGASEHHLSDVTSLPFLSLESDGNPFPQIIEARIEAFCLQVERLADKIIQERADKGGVKNEYIVREKA